MTDELRQQIDQVADRFDGEKSKLYREDGRQRYVGAEHAERLGKIREQFSSSMDEIESEVAEEITRNEIALTAVEFSDPVDSLSVEELERANARRALVSEDVEKLPLEELAGRMKAALASGDRAGMYLLARAARFRVGDPKVATESDADEAGIIQGEFGEDAAAVRDLVVELDQALRPGHSKAVENARQDLESAREIQGYAKLRRQGHKSVLGRHNATQYGYLNAVSLR
jgi:hypothetical protein